MGHQLAFWSDSRAERPDPKQVYLDLMDGKRVAGLGHFDARSVLAVLANSGFPQLEPTPSDATNNASCVSADHSTSFEFEWSEQHLIVEARGAYATDDLNQIIDAVVDNGDGRLYDPQTDERFDSA